MKGCIGSHTRVVACIFVAALVMAVFTPRCSADLYSGTLTADGGGLIAYGVWDVDSTSISWDVSLVGGLWHYEYTFTAEQHALSHFILQVSDSFTTGDIRNLYYDFDGDEENDLAYDLDSYGIHPSNPGIPGDIYGLKFADGEEGLEGFDDSTEWIWSFDSPREPVWGDFYAVDGKTPGTPIPYAYNSGFGVEPGTPDLAWIARPDTTVVPIPPAFLLGMIGLSIAGVKLRKHA